MCKKIHRGGNAEQYHAEKKYKEAVAVAVEKCAAATKPLRHVREDRDAGGAAGALARIHTYVGPHRADDDAAVALLREVLQVGGHLGDVEFGVAWNLDTTLPAFIN